MSLTLRNVPPELNEIALTRLVRITVALDPEESLTSILQQILGQFEEASQGESADTILLTQEVHDINFLLGLVGDDLKRFLTNSAELCDRVLQFLAQNNIEITYTRTDS